MYCIIDFKIIAHNTHLLTLHYVSQNSSRFSKCAFDVLKNYPFIVFLYSVSLLFNWLPLFQLFFWRCKWWIGPLLPRHPSVFFGSDSEYNVVCDYVGKTPIHREKIEPVTRKTVVWFQNEARGSPRHVVVCSGVHLSVVGHGFVWDLGVRQPR